MYFKQVCWWMRRWACVVALLWAVPAHAANLFPPGLHWQSVDSEHFHIHYPEALAPQVAEYARIAEAAHRRQSERLNWSPKGRTHLVLSDHMDAANGMATPLPYNLMVLFASAPDGDAELMLNVDRWRDTLMVHEYSHILHLDRAAGAPWVLRRVFGRLPVLFPNLFNPTWMIEGLATYEETVFSRRGRGRGAYFDGVLRTQALENKLMPVSRASHPVQRWPGGTTRYLYGVDFLEYLAERYGVDVTQRWVADYSNNLLPFLVNRDFAFTTGSPLGSVWAQWREQRTAQANDFAKKRGQSQHTRITHTGYHTGAPRVSPDGRLVAYTESTPNDHAQIRLFPLAGGPTRTLTWRNGGTGMAWLPDGSGLLISQPEVWHGFSVFDDLYTVALADGKLTRLTHGARLREPDMATDGRIVAVQNGQPQPGANQLVLLTLNDPTPRLLTAGDGNSRFADPRFSPSGDAIAVSVSHHGNRHVAWVDTRSGTMRTVSVDGHLSAQPDWSRDGRYLFFSSDRDGVFNLYAWDRQNNLISRMTDVPGGAFTPTDLGNGTLLYTTLHGSGLDLVAMPLNPASWQPAGPITPPLASLPAAPAVSLSEPRPYRPYPAALPRFWFPVAYTEEDRSYLGAFTGGADPLGHHLYTAQLALDPQNERLEYDLTYWYNRFYPTLRISAVQDDLTELLFLSGAHAGWLTERQLIADVIWPVKRSIDAQFDVLVGLELDDLRASCNACFFPGTASNRFLRLGGRYNSAQRYGFGISPQDGQQADITSEFSLPGTGNRQTGSVTVLDWRGFATIKSPLTVAALRASYAHATGNVPLRLGGPPRFSESAFSRDLALRGYARRSFVGDRVLRGSISVRFPLMRPERGVGTWPVFLEKLHGRVFVDAGKTRTTNGWQNAAGFGAELGLDTALGYFIPLSFRLGAARGTGPRGEQQFYLLVTGPTLL